MALTHPPPFGAAFFRSKYYEFRKRSRRKTGKESAKIEKRNWRGRYVVRQRRSRAIRPQYAYQ
jgi:hypothetical protein